jgi:hypothetical protein
MGGIFGSHVDLETLGERWREMLHRHGDIVFHMSELEGNLGEFKDWNKEQRESLLADAIGCLQNLFLVVFGTVVVTKQYRELPDIAQKAFMDPWLMCFQMCISEVGRAIFHRVGDPTSGAKIALFIDQQKEYQGRAVEAFDFFKTFAEYGHRLGTCTPASKVDLIQLQAADLVAYEIRKLVENAIYAPEVGVRWPMRQLQKLPFNCTYMDFWGDVPDLPAGPVSMFKRSTIIIHEGEMKQLNWPVKWPELPEPKDKT